MRPERCWANCYAFRDPPDYVRYLKDAGFTILNNANSHSMGCLGNPFPLLEGDGNRTG